MEQPLFLYIIRGKTRFCHPEVEAITMWSMEDPGYVPASGLFTEKFEPKESFFRIKELEKSWGFDFPVKKA